MRFLIIAVAFFIMPLASALGQALKPEGTFSSDTIKVGEPVKYTLTFRYPRDLEVVFPDEEDQYAPFEYIDRTPYTTYTDSLYSFDSVVYEVSTFELDTVQKLSLPVYVINTDENDDPDSTKIFAIADSVYLDQLVKQMPDSVNIKANTQYRLVNLEFNYPYLLAALGGILLIIILAMVFFGKTIMRRWRVYRLGKENQKFHKQFKSAKKEYQNSPDRQHSVAVLLVWKKYMEALDDLPYTKMTTKEIVAHPSGQLLKDDLRAIDKSIYSRSSNGELVPHFDQLYEHTDSRFKQRIEEIKHAK